MFKFEGNIGVVGKSGSGKSTLGHALLGALGEGWKIVDSGTFFRNALAALGLSVQEGDDIPIELDREVDAMTLALLLEAKQYIIVGRMVSYLAQQQGLGSENYIGISVVCDPEVLARRAREQWNRKKKLPENTPLPTVRQVMRTTKVRDGKDLERYRLAHGIEDEWQLYGPPPNRLLLRSDLMTVEQEVAAVLAMLGAVSF